MDREIPQAIRQKLRHRKYMKYGVIGLAIVVLLIVFVSLMRTSVDEKNLVMAAVDRGTIEVSVSASGTIVPAFEEIINSPINTRILEVYRKGGDSVEVGTPILKLDLQSIETDYKKLQDEKLTKQYQLEQMKVNNETELKDLANQIRVTEMQLHRKQVVLRNEQYLDSIGSGTADQVRQAELDVNVTRLELEQLRQQYEGKQKTLAADLKVKELEITIFNRDMAEVKRTLADAQVRSPRRAILTFVNDQIGVQVAQGEQLAIISDLTHFKVDGEIADVYGDRIAPGGKAVVRIGKEKLEGIVSSVTPLSKGGVISFTVQLYDDGNRRLRSGLKTDVYIMQSIREDVLRLANGAYYVGPGEYELFVRTSDNELTRRKVRLGDSNFDYVEVISGLNQGDEVVVSDMSNYKNKDRLKLKTQN